MLKQMIKNWLNFESATKEDDDITVDAARANYKKYEQGIKKQQQAYMGKLRQQIMHEAELGRLSTITLNTNDDDFMTYDFLQELDTYFTSRGFKVRKEHSKLGIYKAWLRISWEEKTND